MDGEEPKPGTGVTMDEVKEVCSVNVKEWFYNDIEDDNTLHGPFSLKEFLA